jgi:hypothetical protein
MKNKTKLYENIYGFFEYNSCTFAEGAFNISFDNATYKLISKRIVKINRKVFDLFHDLPPIFSFLKSIDKDSEHTFPNSYYLIIEMDYFDNIISNYIDDKKEKQKINLLSSIYHLVKVRIEHLSEFDDNFEYINNCRDRKGISDGKEIFLKVVREFHNYHIVNEAPYHYMSDIHYRNIDGIFSFFSDAFENRISNVQSYSNYWIPKHKKDFQEKTQNFFNTNSIIRIEDLLISKALVYSEQRHYSLAIIHAVMSLEVVVPVLTNMYLKYHDVQRQAIKDFDNKFGLSVRVKAFMKVVFQKEVHPIIDSVGEAISIRNKILHSNFSEQLLSTNKTSELVNSCNLLKDLISAEMNKYQ